MKPTLFVLAAGMGSRYGGLKQLDGLGPNGETIMDYSIFDAIRGGFGKLVFVIRKDFEQDFRDKVLSKYEGHIPTELVFQAIDNLPEGFAVPEERTKPWGTGHAILCCKDAVKEPFASAKFLYRVGNGNEIKLIAIIEIKALKQTLNVSIIRKVTEEAYLHI